MNIQELHKKIYESLTQNKESSFISALEACLDYTAPLLSNVGVFKQVFLNPKFYKSPASTRFHHNYDYGLSVHTLETVFWAIRYTVNYLGNKDETFLRKTVLVSLTHDLEKFDKYNSTELYKKENGKWVTYPGYEVKSNRTALPHAPECMKRLLLLDVNLPVDVVNAVYYHMGLFESHDNINTYSSEMERNPLVWLINTADVSSTKLKIESYHVLEEK